MERNISKYNSSAILDICERIGLETHNIFWSSDLDHEGKSNKLLASLVKAVGCTTYMYGGGASIYQDETVFAEHGIQLKPQNFEHPQYHQFGNTSFIPGLSIIDALMNIGFEGVKDLLII